MIPADSAKCPYCGALNAVGGEKQYMEHLFDLKEDVKDLKDVPLQTYRQELKKSSRIIKRTLFICSIVALLAVGLFLITDKFWYAKMPVAERKEQLLWEKENFPKLDALYADGDYDGILEYDDKDQALVDNYKEAVREMLRSQFDMQDEDYAALYTQCCKEDEYGTFFNYKLAEKKVNAYVKNSMENGKVVR